MKNIKVPFGVKLLDSITGNPILFTDPETNNVGEKVLSFKEFLLTSILNDEKHFGTNLDTIESCFRIRDKVRNTLEGEVFCLDDFDYKLLLEAVKNPSKGYSPLIVCQCLSFTDAIKNASNS